MTLVLGVDAGGTSSRALVADLSGAVLGEGRAGCGNPAAAGPRAALAELSAAVRQALATVDPVQVKAATVGMAGLAGAGADLALAFPVAPDCVGDVVVAFAAGTPAASGTVLISGTGAIASRITGRVQGPTADGYGWQLGDEGSAFWLGREAARSVVRGVPGRLRELVLRHLDAPALDPYPLAEYVAVAVQSAPPLALAELAPLVSRAAAEGDPVAAEIVADAARRLARTLREVHEPGSPVVLAGSVLTTEGPVRQAVLGLLAAEEVHTAGRGEAAAAWLAARTLLSETEATRVHHRFLPPA
ncbi:BadF/BadG/BcrA/BcrD ATPase family protein [Nonomuraea sp. NPDC050310]|uniref:N-acetylglucosamine kinase n=1 Tax=unclassified Nonomuraea TaxID=2593643 RepID=UPI0033D81196